MDMNILLIFGFGLLLVIVNSVVTIAVCRSESYEPRQKLFQLFVIWLVPIIGSVFLWYVMREDSGSDFRSSGDRGNENVEYYNSSTDGHNGGSDSGYGG